MPVKRSPQPTWIQPMLATLTEERFSNPKWIFEKKYDGVRALAFKKGNNIQLLSRNKLSFNNSYSEVVEHLMKTRGNFIIDGEIVALERGISSFSKLQQRMKSSMAVYYFVFDLIYWDQSDVRDLPLLQRKKMLQENIIFDQRIKFTTHKIGEGEKYYEQACRENWEGIIAKRADSQYVSGRSTDWLKFKCSLEQELVIVGYTDPQGARIALGALLVGFYEKNDLIYAGKVGTGFTIQTLRTLHKKLLALERKTPAAKGTGLPRKNVHWVEPKLVAQIAFSEWTSDNKLRHPRYLGLREDKQAPEVVREKINK